MSAEVLNVNVLKGSVSADSMGGYEYPNAIGVIVRTENVSDYTVTKSGKLIAGDMMFAVPQLEVGAPELTERDVKTRTSVTVNFYPSEEAWLNKSAVVVSKSVRDIGEVFTDEQSILNWLVANDENFAGLVVDMVSIPVDAV